MSIFTETSDWIRVFTDVYFVVNVNVSSNTSRELKSVRKKLISYDYIYWKTTLNYTVYPWILQQWNMVETCFTIRGTMWNVQLLISFGRLIYFIILNTTFRGTTFKVVQGRRRVETLKESLLTDQEHKGVSFFIWFYTLI